MTKILIIRFSSIGDIVLTSPVVRHLKNHFQDKAEIHFLTKIQFKDLVEHNPNIDHCHYYENSLTQILPQLKKEGFDYIIDLHKNLRSLRIKRALGVKSYSFEKLNFKKWLLVNFKQDKMPNLHIVDRYLATLKPLGIKKDMEGLDFFFPKHFEVNSILKNCPASYIVYAIGGQFATKKMPEEQIQVLLEKIKSPILLIGGKEDAAVGEKMANLFPHVDSFCGKISLLESAYLCKAADKIISHDTGMMHIASAFQKPIISIWGNTVPSLGMYPYQAGEGSRQFEVGNLSCRPCSKIGFQECPKKHFNCMNLQDLEGISQSINE